jgi:hypothetical protein
MSKVPANKVAPKATLKKPVATTKKASPKKVAAVAVEPEIPILMRPSVARKKKVKTNKKLMNPLEVLFHLNSTSAVMIAFINALNGGLVVVTMLLMMIAFVTELFVVAMRDYSETNQVIAKYRNLVKNKVKRK